MRCLNPRTVGFKADGKTIAWSYKECSKEYAPFQLPCGKCIECRLEYARQWAVRCVHESKVHENNCFITLTYNDENLPEKLKYEDFQKFMKDLRSKVYYDYCKKHNIEPKALTKEGRKALSQKLEIGMFVTGEYGDIKKRPHWHVLLFNYQPDDMVFKYSNERGDRVYESETINKLWGKGMTDIGSVTFESAGYVARYAAKKLTHGNDGHEYEPISKKSQKNAIGKRFLEKYYKDIFNIGYVVMDSGQTMPIPRYYLKWLEKNKPDEYRIYLETHKAKQVSNITKKQIKEEQKLIESNNKRPLGKGALISRNKVKTTITKERFKRLQEYKKL